MLMGCSSQELITALSTHKIQPGEDTVAKSLTLLQVCLLLNHVHPSIFCGSKGSLFSMFIYLSFTHSILRQLKQEMQLPNLFMQACLNGLYNKLTSHLKWVKNTQRNSLVSLIFMGFSHSRYSICINIYMLQRCAWYMFLQFLVSLFRRTTLNSFA
jgi:hypothetical protein